MVHHVHVKFLLLLIRSPLLPDRARDFLASLAVNHSHHPSALALILGWEWCLLEKGDDLKISGAAKSGPLAGWTGMELGSCSFV
jgi:hypothetical protein